MSSLVDAPARASALDPGASFCITAPAGSGKTELLIQRYLRLLSRVSRPEQVLAITFTRKAAAEMRHRVMHALQSAMTGAECASSHLRVTRDLALQALAANERGNWCLLENIARFNIKTIDSFCAGLTRQMPVLSQFGGQAKVQDDATLLIVKPTENNLEVVQRYQVADSATWAHPVVLQNQLLIKDATSLILWRLN